MTLWVESPEPAPKRFPSTEKTEGYCISPTAAGTKIGQAEASAIERYSYMHAYFVLQIVGWHC